MVSITEAFAAESDVIVSHITPPGFLLNYTRNNKNLKRTNLGTAKASHGDQLWEKL